MAKAKPTSKTESEIPIRKFAAVGGEPAATSELFRLEPDFHSAVSMSYIAADLIENAFRDKDAHKLLTGKLNTYHFEEEEVEAMLFAIYETHDMIKAIRDKYLNGLTTP